VALVDALGAALAHEPWPPILLERAAASGRVRAFALEHAAGVRAKPRHALRLPTALRQARHLQSKERRLVTEALYDLIRWRGLYALVLGTDALDAHWLAWLTTQGLPPGPNGYNALVDLQGLGARLEALAPLDALQAVLGGDRAFTAAVRRSLGNEAMAFCLASQRRGPTVLRAHAGRGSQGALLSALRAEGVEAEPTPYASHGVRVLQRANLVGSRGFKEGLFEVQDEGSQLIAELVDPTAQTVLDLCAGAGGKSLAILAASGSAVTACDVRPAALQALRKRAERAQTPVETLELGPDGDPPRALAGR
jgi:16S rRNA (cytosine967-C5)-methyltransferase